MSTKSEMKLMDMMTLMDHLFGVCQNVKAQNNPQMNSLLVGCGYSNVNANLFTLGRPTSVPNLVHVQETIC